MILGPEAARAEPRPCAGLLVIGDPHVSSRRPGRRTDADWPGAILAKLSHCVATANARDLAPVLLGDLFERAAEPDTALVSRLVRLLKAFRHRPLANVGNHDAAHTRLSDGDTLAVLALADVIDVAPASGACANYLCGGRAVALGATPYGQAIPDRVGDAAPGADAVVWLTHHDLAFGQSYPGAVPPPAIEGCALAINGHVHARQPSLAVGGTRWFNPGTINRRTLDLVDHVPAAWILDPALGLAEERLPCAPHVFDLTGRQVDALAPAAAPTAQSAFVALLTAEAGTDLARSDDGAMLAETIEAKFCRDGTAEPVRSAIRALLAEAVDRRER